MAKVKQYEIDGTALRLERKSKKPKVQRDLRTMFRKLLAGIRADGIDKIKKPWMATKSFRLLATKEALAEWVDGVLADKSCWKVPYEGAELQPVVAVDTETIGLDDRIFTGFKRCYDAQGNPGWETIWEVKAEIAGVCLSVDGITGVYIPVNHEDGNNVSREDVHYELQRLFDVSHLVFYNAKFDREVMRCTLAMNFRPYPHYEDVQVLQYICDPKADLEGDKKRKSFTAGIGDGLKDLSKNLLGMEQIELETLVKVKADWVDPKVIPDPTKKLKVTQHVQYCPFTWVPTEIALWYAASDAICTWLLWDKRRDLAQSRRAAHRIDGQSIDTLTWIERQRPLIDVEPLKRVSRWHTRTMVERQQKLAEIAVEAGWPLQTDEEGNVIESSLFKVGSDKDLPLLLYSIMGLPVVKKTPKGKPSTDADALDTLLKKCPDNKFLIALEDFKRYASLHPDKLTYDPNDYSGRLYLKQCVVAGGRFSGTGGNFEKDGGMGMNPQAIKSVEAAWYVYGKLLHPDMVNPEDVEPHEENELDPSCFRKDKTGKTIQAPGIIKNHIANFLGYALCLVPGCTTCREKHGVLVERGKLDAFQTINLRALFIAAEGWTFATTDYSNIEMRIAANQSREPVFLREFLTGSGDFHTLTAIAIFPEFSDPNTPNARKKELRGYAKICNFQLLYGGTEFTIYTNLKPHLPDITMQKARKMFDDYWASVPVFRAYCDEHIKRVKEFMTCETATGRVINFQSQMDALHLHVPTKFEMDNFFEYHRVSKRAKAAEEEGDVEAAQRLKEHADRLWKDPETGVRNASDYNKFMSKIQKVCVNVPLQGLAGDFMRSALNHIRIWATEKEPNVQAVLRIHLSVHDEIDYSFLNRYSAFVVPRMTRMMKLRTVHAKSGWEVPIEADTEYGRSWDVTFHLTGDDGHKPAGWTDIKGMENYLPDEFSPELVEKLIQAISSDNDAHREKARGWFKDVLHPRANGAVDHAFWSVDKDKQQHRVTDPAVIRKQVIAALQLHEYWLIDETPDDRDDLLETLEQYEARCGLTVADRGYMPPGGFLCAVPLKGVKRPELPLLGPEPEPGPGTQGVLPLDLPLISLSDQADDLRDRARQLDAEAEEAELGPRVVHVHRDLFDVYIGRNCEEHAESKWANPFHIGEDGSREEVIEKYEEYIRNAPWLMRDIPELVGKVLGCWCAPEACHGEVLLKLVAEYLASRAICPEPTPESTCPEDVSITPTLPPVPPPVVMPPLGKLFEEPAAVDEFLLPPPKKRDSPPIVKVPAFVLPALPPVNPRGLPVLRNLDREERKRFRKVLSYGDCTLEVFDKALGCEWVFERVRSSEIPEEFIQS